MFINKIKLKNHYIAEKQRHPFHVVDPSPWPILVSIALFNIVLSTVLFLHGVSAYASNLYFGFVFLFFFLFGWFWDIILEATYAGKHTEIVVRGLQYWMIIFIISEVMFFFSFFSLFFIMLFHLLFELVVLDLL